MPLDRALGSLLKLIRLADGDFAYVETLGNHAIKFEPPNRVFFHLVLRGSPVLIDELHHVETPLGVGDYIIVLDNRPHSLGPPDSGPPQPVSYFSVEHHNDLPNSLAFGSGRVTAKTLTGCVSLDTALALSVLKTLPGILIIDGQSRGIVHATRYVYESRHLYQTTRGPGANQFLLRLVELFLVEAIRIGMANLTLPLESALHVRGISQIIEAILIMTREIQKKWSVSALAGRVGMSRSAFAAAFTSATGKPPLRYLADLRIQRAAHLLEVENCSIKEVAHRVGYDSDIAFGHAFKRHIGKTPTDYRRAALSSSLLTLEDLGHWSDFVAS